GKPMRQFSLQTRAQFQTLTRLSRARRSIGGAYRPFRSGLLICLEVRAEGVVPGDREGKVEQKAPPADGNTWDEAGSQNAPPHPLTLMTSVHAGFRPQAFACGPCCMPRAKEFETWPKYLPFSIPTRSTAIPPNMPATTSPRSITTPTA